MKEHSGRKEAQYGDEHKILFTKVVPERGGPDITINLFENAKRAPLSAQYLLRRPCKQAALFLNFARSSASSLFVNGSHAKHEQLRDHWLAHQTKVQAKLSVM